MSTTTTAVEDARTIREEYKRRGWSNRDVSVRTGGGSLSSSITITIKSVSVDAEEAEEIARRVAESIDRDERTHEILSGGNRFVSVKYADDVKEIMARRHLEALEDAIRELPEHPTSEAVPIPGLGTYAYVGRSGPSRAFIDVEGGPDIMFRPDTEAGREDGAFRLAKALD